ncbi:MAG: lysophospholipid acyltransferase family protein [Gemmatimonadaceae bacterium]|nr:lysophospholipid acyltransferase family protein [Gemmatimonadaceae bacterium]NUQ94533.1 lysophospholipid acyltransferase family protein [Gemmatimonadaceae bacterium]NUR20570.1 lysophospholipid acyltransferase family protein [Gemmatimonadaceae bacterium]NUS98343.1 lysophospholipid acyltransferase family protein [Gemmatimonadaceae bacterium]
MSDATPAEDAPSAKMRWIARVGALILRALALTWRIHVVNDGGLRAERAAGRAVIFSLWHGQMLPLLYQHRGEGVAVLISEHRDGEIVARIAAALGFETVRGSTSRGAARALIGLVRTLSGGRDVAVTPDGPRGPAKSYAPGALVAAQRTGAAIVPVVAAPRSTWRLRSWDSFMIPKPFTRIVIAYGEPARVEVENLRGAADEAPRFQRMMEEAERVALAS